MEHCGEVAKKLHRFAAQAHKHESPTSLKNSRFCSQIFQHHQAGQEKFLEHRLELTRSYKNPSPTNGQRGCFCHAWLLDARQYTAKGISCPEKCPNKTLRAHRVQDFAASRVRGPVPRSGWRSSTTLRSTRKKLSNTHLVEGRCMLSGSKRFASCCFIQSFASENLSNQGEPWFVQSTYVDPSSMCSNTDPKAFFA